MAKKTKISRQISKKPASVKKAITSDLGVTLSNSEAVILTEYRGLTVPQMGEIRTKLRELGDGDFSVVKNTLMRIALKEQGIDDERVDVLLNGTTAATIASSDPVGVAKVVVDYIAANRNTPLKIKGGVVGGRYFGPEQINALSKVPPRDVLLSQMLGAFNSPISSLVYTLQGVISNFVYTLKAIEDKKAAA
jgi:large subunit ribosomal protein L10